MPRKPVRLTVYNHKGGVGKTTITVNTALALASLGKSVLLVDTDPQCNLTSYLLADDVVDDLLDKSDTADGGTIWTSVKPIFDGTGEGIVVEPKEIGNLCLIPGDIRLSGFEEFLGEAWTDSFKRRLGGLRATASINHLVAEVHKRRAFDFVFYDTGPNIGPLNRVLLLGSDFFIVPVACDLFSVRALSTLGQSLKRWVIDCQTIQSLAPDGASLLPGCPQFLGYIPQRFRVYGQVMAREPSTYLRQIKKRMNDDITAVLKAVDPDLVKVTSADPMLGQVQDFASLVQAAQREGVALWECSNPNETLKAQAKKSFAGIASEIVRLTQGEIPSVSTGGR